MENNVGVSIVNSNYTNPDYLFNNALVYIKQFFVYVTSDQAVSIEKSILFILSLFFLTIICYSLVRIFEVREKEHAHLHHEIHEYAHKKAEKEKKAQEKTSGSKNERWVKTLDYLFSQHASDWKLAIIEADNMLDILMSELGFKGESLGDKLKSANQDNFKELTKAWEVHTIRNRIAHEGTAFEISQHEAKRVIALYEYIFHEYGYI